MVTATAAPAASKHWPASIYRRPDGGVEQGLSPARLREILRVGEGELWVDVDSNDLHQHALLEKVFDFHPLAVEDTLSPRTRVKLEEYDRYVFVVMAGVAFDQAVDAYFPLVEELSGMVDGLEQKLFEEFDEGLIHEIFKAKRATFALRRHIGPLREVLNILTNRPCGYIRPETQLYYRDVYDHTIRLMESVDTTRDLLAGVLETYLSQTSNRMNRVMKQLSIVATVALPLIVIAGIYGMNFSRMPLIHDPLGFWVAVGSMAIVSLAIVGWLKRRKWL